MQRLSYGRHKKYWLVLGPVVFVVLFASLIVGIYKNTLDDIKKDHQFQQLEMTKSTAQGITYLIHHLVSDIRLLSNYPGIKDVNSHSLSFIKQLPAAYDSEIVRSVFVTDKNLKVCCFSGEPVDAWEIYYTRQAVSSGRSGDYFISAVSSNEMTKPDPKLYFQIVIPILNKASPAGGDTIGYLGYLINFNGLVDQFIRPLKLSKNDFAWIIDGMGRLIYHPLHKEMLLRSINNTTPGCSQCHKSFSVQQSIVKASGPSFGEYSVVENEPDKIMAYFPVKIGNQKWVLVISTLVTHVTESLREKFKIFFIIGFVILGLLLLFSSLIYVINSRRIRAEEAKRNLEQIQAYQEQLNQASKLASIGELVDSVAHEINTPTGIIAAHVDGIILSNNSPDGILPTLKIIRKQAERISNYTKSLLSYSKRMTFYPEPINIKSVIEECLYLLGHRFRSKRIRINRNFEGDIPVVYADSRQMEQVFMNLLNNAIDAVDSHGEITIRLGSENNNGTLNAVISIEDNGTGIAEENLPKIFTAFFTTKQNSNGTGLGLSIVKAIIVRHEGKITVKSEPGKSTIFNITLPGAAGNNIRGSIK
ncbi:MAG TPA: ATP-binding protein [Ignavibacteriales bacterium]|nr:ATP-binding protein [Ignavibacteriales bacterium]